jgi:tRNA threonylcarbamoyladenosine biosynthesis protein TsaE
MGMEVSGPVVSPTFILLAEYEGTIPLLHADAYRIKTHEVRSVGLEDILDDWEGVSLVEWADRFPQVLPSDYLLVRFHTPEPGTRELQISATGPTHAALLHRLRTAWESSA